MSGRRSIEIVGFGHGGQPIPAASRVGPLLATGGVYGLDPATGTLPDDVGEQVRLMFANLARILEAGGGTMGAIARMTVFVKDPAARGAVNDEWVRTFPDADRRPARHTLVNDNLPGKMAVQCDAMAWIDPAGDGATASDAIATRLHAIDTPTLSDALDALGMPGAVFGIGALTVERKIAGQVRTVKLGPPLTNAPKKHLGAGAIMAAARGEIIVVEHGRVDVSGWGGLLSRGAVANGIAGVIVDGAVRDVDEAEEIGFPVYARAAVPVTARGRVAEHGFDVPIAFAGVTVSPHDWVLADGSGVVFVPGARVAEVLETAERIFAREQLMARDIVAGVPIGEVMGADYEDLLSKVSK
jgi:regulator of RNase E activity RraA/enamine deaminase RidA (YjgF/YER057c/UK114 family)